MAADGTWGDHVILHGAAKCFKTEIHVISSLSHQHDLTISPGCDVDNSNGLVLGHVHELHYVSLIEPKRGNCVFTLQTKSCKWQIVIPFTSWVGERVAGWAVRQTALPALVSRRILK